MSNIPDGWIYTLLSEIALIQMGQSPNSRSYNNKGEGLPFFQGKADFGKLFPTVRKWCTEPERVAEEGDILLSVRAPVGPTNLATERCCIGRGLAAIQAIPPFNQKCLLHYFRYIEPWLSQQGTGTTFAGIGSKVIQNLEIPVAPLNEQKRIADKLDSLFARVDACRDRLNRVPRILKRFHQSVLATAISGQIVNENGLQTEGDKATTLRLAQVVEQLKTGPFGSTLHKSDYIHNGIPIVNPMHINAGCITPTDNMTVSVEKAEELQEYFLREGDIVVARRGVMGRCAVVGINEQGWLCGSGSMIIRTTDQVLPKYLQIVLSSPDVVKTLEANAVGSTMVNLNQKILLDLLVPVPSIAVQKLIIHHVGVLFAYADRLEVRYQNALKQVEKIKSALLSMAFRGELMPQDPNDEPAAVLLERIRAEQIAKPKQVVVNRKPKMPKMTEDSVREVIRQLSSETFSFDELREKISGDYDSFKDILFTLLSEAEPILTQVFDQEAEAMRFVRRKQ